MNNTTNNMGEMTHTPESLSNFLSDSLQAPTDRKLFQIEGVYIDGKGKVYGQLYYDSLVDAVTERKLTLRVPKNIKPQLVDGTCYQFSGFLNHMIPNRPDINISLNFHVMKVLDDRGKSSDNVDAGATLLEEKSEQGFKNVEKFIFTQFSKNKNPVVYLVVGNEAITDNDFVIGMGDALAVYDLQEHRINLNSPNEIIDKITALDKEDECIIALVRGGGDLDIFNDVSIVRSVVSLKNVFVTAIGHASDVSILDRVADQRFDTPSFLGAFFKERAVLYRRNVEESDRRETTISNLRKENEKLIGMNRSLNENLSGKDLALNGIFNGVEAIDKSINSLSTRIIKIARWHSLGKLVVSFLLGVVATIIYPDILRLVERYFK